jgi:hypothetical protein
MKSIPIGSDSNFAGQHFGLSPAGLEKTPGFI